MVCSGAPFDQGAAQGLACREAARRELSVHGERLGLLASRDARRRAHRQSGRPLQRFLPQLHERLRGLAAGADVSARALAALDGFVRVHGESRAKGAELEVCWDLGGAGFADAERALLVRESVPDAVGYRSLELAAAPFPGCLAGVNECGVAVAVLAEHGADGPSLKSYAADVLMRANTLASARHHLAVRGPYAGGNGRLLVCDEAGAGARFELRDGALSEAASPLGLGPFEAGAALRVDAASRTLTWAGATHRLGPAA